MKYLLATTALVLAFAGAANADTLKFFTGTTAYGTGGGVFSGPNTVYNSIQNNTTVCANNGSCASDTITGSQIYGIGTDGLTATANTGQMVWDDAQPNFGGLGVGTGLVTENDNIDGTNILTLTFNVPVQLTGIATLFDTSAHGPFGNLTNIGSQTFLLNGVATRFDVANLALLNLATGTTFTFQENGSNSSFYVSGISFIPGQSTGQTPLPGTIGFLAAGLTGLIGLGRRKFRQPAA